LVGAEGFEPPTHSV